MVYTFTFHADFRTQPPHIRESTSCGFHLSAEVKCEIENKSQGLLGKCFPSGRRFSVESVFLWDIVQVNSVPRE